MTLEFDGEQYTRASTHQREWGTKLIESLKLNGDERILDLGCGDGVLTLELARRVPRGAVVGIDASTGMLDVARRKVSRNLNFDLLDIDALSYDREFHVVFSNATLHFVKDHPRLLENTHRALHDEGVLRCSFGGDGNCVHFIDAVRNAMGAEEFAPFFEHFEWPYYMPKVDVYRVLIEKSPFSAYEVWGENADRYFPDAETITRWIDQPCIVPFLDVVSEPFKRSFRDSVVEQVLATTRQEDGTHFETFRRVQLVATK